MPGEDKGEHLLPRLRLLQIGDIHLPTAGARQGPLDDKDPAFPTSIRSVIVDQPLQVVFRKLFQLLSNGEIDCALFMGDLTDLGRLEGFEACCKYIATALQLGSKGSLSHLKVGIVPGNHDVDRALANKADMREKFAPLNVALTSVGLPELPIDTVSQIDVTRDSLAAKVFLANSCWGCGESEHIPETFRGAIADAIAKTLDGREAEKARKTYYDRQLDTPAVSSDTLQSIIDGINNCSSGAIPVIVAHHNLLPQRITRLAPYTELVNSGALRSSLQELDRPVVYLHGHIHDEPIEVLHAPRKAPLIIISAPEITKGFNIVELVFTPMGLPLSCHVRPWRFDGSGLLREYEELRTCLLSKKTRASNPQLSQLFSKLLEHGQCYWTDVVKISEGIFSTFDDSLIVQQLELLLADDCINIENYDHHYKHWITRASV